MRGWCLRRITRFVVKKSTVAATEAWPSAHEFPASIHEALPAQAVVAK